MKKQKMCFFRKALFLKQPTLLFQLKQFYITMTFSINDVNEAVPVSVTLNKFYTLFW